MRAAFFRHCLLGLVTLAVAVSVLPAEVRAQADPNIDARIESAVPVDRDLLAPPILVQDGYTPVVIVRTPEQRFQILKDSGMRPAGFEKLSPEQQLKLLNDKVPAVVTRYVPKFVAKPRPTEFKLTPSFSYSHETNATRSRLNPTADNSVGFGLQFSVKVPVAKAPDAVTFMVGTASGRYANMEALNFDTVISSVKYATVIKTTPYSTLSPGKTHNIVDVLVTGIDTRSAFALTFERNTLNYYFPSVTWVRQNIPLTNSTCGKGDEKHYCLLMDTSIGMQHTVFDQPFRDFTLGEVGASIYSTDIIKGAKVSLNGSIGYKQFADVPGDRTDWIYKFGAGIEKVIGKGTFSAGVSYLSQDSTLLNANYRGATIAPNIKIVIPLH